MKHLLRKFLYISTLCLAGLILPLEGIMAQQIITGRVTDAGDGQPMPGVNVVVRGTTTGTITDMEGNYSIRVSDPNAVLLFSYVGYLDQEYPVDGLTVINLEMKEDIQSLEEVVVIGYGTVKKEDLTGSVAVVTSEEISRTPSPTLSRAIQGRASGVLVTQGGKPGTGVTIRIRGIGSINQNPNPLYVIDGVISGGIDNINPNDIASFQVLKDASAAAIYGADGANGVVIITTKRGREGKPRVSFSTYGSMNLVPKQFDVMNADQYAKFYNEIYEANSIEPNEAYSDRFRELYYGEGWEEGTSWQNEIIQRAYTQNYYLGVSGGGENSNYAISANMLDEQGILRGTGATRYNFRANSDFEIGKYIRVGESFTVSRSTRQDEGTWQGNPWQVSLITSPLMRVYNEDLKGGYEGPQIPFEFMTGTDTIQALNSGGNDKPNPRAPLDIAQLNTSYNSFLGSIYMEISPFEWLRFRTTPSADGTFVHTRNWFPAFESGVRTKSEATLDENFAENLTLSIENQLTLQKSLGNHNITLTGVHHARSYNGYSSNVAARGFEYENLNTIHNSDAELLTATGYYTPVRWISYLGRVIYDYNGKYLLTASVRRDGNSRFGPGNRWGTFPSASVAWKLNEDLLQGVDAIDMLKIRAGYGMTGFSDIGNFRYEGLLSKFTDFSPVFGVSQQVAPALNVLYDFGNELIQWESSAMTNIGLDASLFRNRLSGSAEYYIKDTDNLIVARSVSDVFGKIGNPFVNLGNIRNRGFEFNASLRDMEGLFNYEITGTLTTIKNEVIDLPETYLSGNNIARVGNTVGSLYGYIAERIVTPEDFDTEGNYLHPVPSSGVPEPGDIKYTDLNLDGVINDQDRTIIGKPIPDFIYSLNVNLYYRSFDFSMFWYGARHVDVFNSQRADIESFSTQDINHNKTVAYSENYYREDRPSDQYVRADLYNRNQNDRISTWWVEDASYLRLKDIQIGYSLPRSIGGSLGISRARIYVSAVNLWTLTDYRGRDPEAPTSGSPMNVGTDGSSYPLPRVLTAGMQIDF
ncbi:MAG TPA: TonB-dependent receptor [Bacteroides sp.]|nr:TonB-dependent receptor [Bacteroides sp.]